MNQSLRKTAAFLTGILILKDLNGFCQQEMLMFESKQVLLDFSIDSFNKTDEHKWRSFD